MGYTLLFFLILMIAVNFVVVRPHRKSFNKRAIMLNSVKAGTIVYTVDGIRAEVDAVNRDVISLNCYPDGVKLLVELEAVDRIENYDEEYARHLMDAKIQKGHEKYGKRAAQKKSRKRGFMKGRGEDSGENAQNL